MASHVRPDDGAVQAPPVPKMSYIAAAVRANAGLAPTTGMSQPTGVGPTNAVDLTDATDDDNNNKPPPTLPKVEVEDIPMEEIDKDTVPADMESTPV
eukprot:4297585-Ditylum_brightwellii.AAC.1